MRAGGLRGRRAAAAALGLAAAVVAAAGVWWLAERRAHEVEVFFVRFDPQHHRAGLVAVRRPAPAGPVERRLEAAVLVLLAGPPAPGRGGPAGLVTEIPAGTALRGLRVAGGTVTVDLSSRYASGGGSTSMQARVWQVVYTATQFPEARAAEILIEGRRMESLGGEGVPIAGPLERSRSPAWF